MKFYKLKSTNMKTFLSITIALLFTLCSFAQEKTKVETLKTFLDGTITFQNSEVNESEPLIDIKALAEKQAEKKIALTKESISAALDDIKKYNHAIIIVGKHTIAKITDAPNCKDSGSWGACMPFGKGLIQKSGAFKAEENYINYIIGIPDSQERLLYLFN